MIGDWCHGEACQSTTAPMTQPMYRAVFDKNFDFRNGRDANGPIFPTGDVDPRLPVHEDVIGAITTSGKPLAFPRAAAYLALRDGQEITFENLVS